MKRTSLKNILVAIGLILTGTVFGQTTVNITDAGISINGGAATAWQAARQLTAPTNYNVVGTVTGYTTAVSAPSSTYTYNNLGAIVGTYTCGGAAAGIWFDESVLPHPWSVNDETTDSPSYKSVWMRLAFTMPSGPISTASDYTFTLDDVADVWVNGTYVGSATRIGTGGSSVGVPLVVSGATMASLLVPGASNVIAAKAQNKWVYCRSFHVTTALAVCASSFSCLSSGCISDSFVHNMVLGNNENIGQLTAGYYGGASATDKWIGTGTDADGVSPKGDKLYGLAIENTGYKAFYGSRPNANGVDALIAWGSNANATKDRLIFEFHPDTTGCTSTPKEIATMLNNGNVGIGISAPIAPLDVYRPEIGTSTQPIGINVLNHDDVSGTASAMGVFSVTDSKNNTGNVGVFGAAENAKTTNTGVTGWGIGGTTDYGGSFTAFSGSSVNYGVYASYVGGNTPSASNCAGYMNGALYGSGGFYTPSDQMLKSNVKPAESTLAQLRKLEVSSYVYKSAELKGMNLPEGDQIGIMAQNLQSVFPNLVKPMISPASETGKDIHFLAVNYTGLIPVLVAGLKEMDTKVDALQKENADLKQQLNDICSGGCASLKGNTSDATSTGNALLQNVPNPFNQQTTIGYVINTGNTASMNINSLDGKLIKHLDITTKGTGSVSISSADMNPGTYTYSLYVDGKVVDTKIMVISAKD